nr:hypothetical protein [uncultured Arsenicibacter sp.]
MSPAARAQGLGNSPYSALGVGEEYSQANIANLGMGSVGISNANTIHLNLQNPALLARRARFTVFEVGIIGQYKPQISQNQGGATMSQRDFGANINYIALAFPASSRWTASLNLRPYSYVDYQTKVFDKVPNTIYEVQKNYSGKGALNKASFSNGFRLFKNLYVGVEATYLFGNITNNSDSRLLINDVVSSVQPQDITVSRINRTNYSDIIWKLGGAWRPKLGEKWTLNVGATYDPKTNVKAVQTDVNQLVTLSGTSLSDPDTLRSNLAGHVTLPEQVQFGISLERNNKLTVGVDVGFQKWSQFRTADNSNPKLMNGMRIGAGLEYVPKITSTKYWDLVTYRAGFQYIKSPYQVSGKQLNDINGSLGISLPIGSYFVNNLNLAVVGGQRGTLVGTQIRERYVKIALGFTLNDKWFYRYALD